MYRSTKKSNRSVKKYKTVKSQKNDTKNTKKKWSPKTCKTVVKETISVHTKEQKIMNTFKSEISNNRHVNDFAIDAGGCVIGKLLAALMFPHELEQIIFDCIGTKVLASYSKDTSNLSFVPRWNFNFTHNSWVYNINLTQWTKYDVDQSKPYHKNFYSNNLHTSCSSALTICREYMESDYSDIYCLSKQYCYDPSNNSGKIKIFDKEDLKILGDGYGHMLNSLFEEDNPHHKELCISANGNFSYKTLDPKKSFSEGEIEEIKEIIKDSDLNNFHVFEGILAHYEDCDVFIVLLKKQSHFYESLIYSYKVIKRLLIEIFPWVKG